MRRMCIATMRLRESFVKLYQDVSRWTMRVI